jgi:hypothetical protein
MYKKVLVRILVLIIIGVSAYLFYQSRPSKIPIDDIQINNTSSVNESTSAISSISSKVAKLPEKREESTSSSAITELPIKKGSFTCDDFTINFDKNKLQVGILDGLSQKFTKEEYDSPKFSDPNKDPEFIEYTKNSKTCGKNKLDLSLYPAGYQLYCWVCDSNLFPIKFGLYDDEFDREEEFVKVQNVTKPFITNAQVREYQSDGITMNKNHIIEFVFEYQGVKYILKDSTVFTIEDNSKEKIAEIITNFEKLVEDFEIKGEKGSNIWGKYIPQTSTFKCGGLGIKYDPSIYQVGLSYDNILAEGNPYDEQRYLAFSKFTNDTKSCTGPFGGLYRVGAKPKCYPCDGITFPSITLQETEDPVDKRYDEVVYTKINSTKNIDKKGLENAKIINYESQGYQKQKESYSALTFDFKEKHYILQLQESRIKAGSDFKSSAEYDLMFKNLIDNLEVLG